jgi:Transposase
MGTGKRRNAEQIQRALREADRDWAKGLAAGDACRKLGVTQTTYYRWRQRHDPAEVDDGRLSNMGKNMMGLDIQTELIIAREIDSHHVG